MQTQSNAFLSRRGTEYNVRNVLDQGHFRDISFIFIFTFNNSSSISN